ncbi:MAG: ElyC/SanA/YdcF family protein [Chloroflexota bacterium]
MKIAAVLMILLILPRAASLLLSSSIFETVEDTTNYETAIILAAEVHPNGRPSAVLRDRIEAGIELYNNGKVNTLVMSGESPEPEIMRDYAIEQGVPPEAIQLDNYGLRTYDTCYRAANVFGLEEAIVVTQLFHLPRTLLLCKQMGIEVVGVPARHTVYWPHQTLWWQTRETFATILAFSDLFLSPPEVSDLPYNQ